MKTHFRNPGLVRIHINDGRAFTVKLVDAADLKTGLVLTDDRVELLRRKHKLEEAYLRSIQYLGYRPRSSREIKQHLNKNKYHPEIVAVTIQRLIASQLIDDKAFASWWVSHRCRFKPRSAYALRFELLQKGIDEGIITAVLAKTDDSKMAVELLEAKRKQWRRLDPQKKRQKILALLHRRGFGYETAKSAYEEYILNTEDRTDDDEAS